MAEKLDISLAELYSSLEGERSATADRAETCADLSLPYAFPKEDIKNSDNLTRGYTQGFMAQLVNNLVGKLALTILPPSQPFYRFAPTQEALDAITKGDENKRFEIEKILAKKEEGVLRYINKSNFRASLYPALRLSIITGNCIIEKVPPTKQNKNGSYKVINLRDYVIKRDFQGTITDFVIKEVLAYDTLPEEFKSQVPEEQKEGDIDLYTGVRLIDDSYIMTQELLGSPVGNETTLKTFEDKFIDLTWNLIDGEDYGRSFFEDHLGTVIALEKLTTAVFEGIAESLKIIKLVNPNGLTSYEDYVDAEHGDAIIGQEGDVTEITSGKTNDLMVAKQLIDEMKQELAKAFLVTGAAIRHSERTTAEEVSIVAQEIEASLGGNYTAIGDKVQRPIITQGMSELKVDAGEDIDVIITTGVQALGRNVEMSKIRNVMMELSQLGQIIGPEAIQQSINADAVISAIIANSGVASKEFVYSKMEKDQKEVAAKEDQLAMQMAQGGLPQMGQNMANAAMQGGM